MEKKGQRSDILHFSEKKKLFAFCRNAFDSLILISNLTFNSIHYATKRVEYVQTYQLSCFLVM